MFSFGSSIVVSTIFVPRLYTQLIHDPLCVLLLEDQSLSFSDVDSSDVRMLYYVCMSTCQNWLC